MVSGRFILMLSVIFLVIAAVTYVLHLIFRKYRFIKYVPVLSMVGAAGYHAYLSTVPSTGFQDLARIVLAMMFGAGAAAGLLTGLLLDFGLPRLQKNRKPPEGGL